MTTTPDTATIPDYFTTAQSREIGLGKRDLATFLAAGLIRRVGRGRYSSLPALPVAGQQWEMVAAEHRRRCLDAISRHPTHVVSHQSAASLLGLGVILHPDADVHLTAARTLPRSRREPGVQLHHCDSIDTVTVRFEGVRITSLARTVADCLRTGRMASGVALVDETVRDGRLTIDQITHAVNDQFRWTGRPKALSAIALHDPRHETWLESYSFAALAEHALPPLVPQAEVYDDTFRFVGRVDGLMPTVGVFLEADGEGKYLLGTVGGAMSAEESTASIRAAEHRRHARLENLGLLGVRWTPAQIRDDPDAVARRIRQAAWTSQRNRPRGWWRGQEGLVRFPDLPSDVRAG